MDPYVLGSVGYSRDRSAAVVIRVTCWGLPLGPIETAAAAACLWHPDIIRHHTTLMQGRTLRRSLQGLRLVEALPDP